MCGRFTNRYSWRELKELYELSDTLYPQAPSNFEPRYNIAPTQTSFVVRPSADGQRELVQLRWGLLPRWATAPRDGARMINARCETVATSRAYQEPFRLRPCLVVADGFYEWASPFGRFRWFCSSPHNVTTNSPVFSMISIGCAAGCSRIG